MSSNFLQRFKGKTQQISKQGVNDILGSKKSEIAHNPNQPSKNKTYNSGNQKPSTLQNVNPPTKKKESNTKIPASKTNYNNNENSKKVENPFLVSNPFYLDQEQRQRQQIQKRQRLRLEQQIKKAQRAQKDQKQVTKTSLISRSLQKKNPDKKGWTKLGGLGANVGGQEWQIRKKKLQKMQQFSGQVKNINAERIKPPRPDQKKQQKQVNSRQKMLQYSKNIPKPVLRRQQPQQQQYIERKSPKKQDQQGLTELQIYQMKHQQLKKMLNNKY